MAANVGKNMLNDRDALQQPSAVPTNQTLQSVINDSRSDNPADDLEPTES